MNLPSVSIAVLSHNYERYLDEAIASTTDQEPGDYRLAEVVVIDDGSTDGSIVVCERYPNVRLVRKAHAGFGDTLTRAVEETAADWIALLDADDAFMPNKLRTLSPYLADRRLLFVQHAEYVVDADGYPFAEDSHPGGATSTLVVRTDAARALLPVTNELFFHVLAELGYGIKVDEPLTRYRVHDASMTDRRTPGAFSNYMAGVMANVAERLAELATTPPAWATAARLVELAATYRRRAARIRTHADRERREGRMP
ncbi:MAG: glycosyltransferase [Actinophytocola sp.]|uniref:glycosyltransferase family 2 protein n=1 Tax=Actinophytocola sp. TaxID=1872138 RepID=UPI0013222ECB|nr:glycosyltransferase family 2 protein [Actinophytocola sp.]MPZ81978.1 glycosyltransferase [Actinophytocola sp.]